MMSSEERTSVEAEGYRNPSVSSSRFLVAKGDFRTGFVVDLKVPLRYLFHPKVVDQRSSKVLDDVMVPLRRTSWGGVGGGCGRV